MKRDPNVVFEGAIPENYDRYLGPVHVISAVSQKIAENCGSAPVEGTMQAFVWRALHEDRD